MNSQKVGFPLLCHSGLDPESSKFKQFWTPAFAGVTGLAFYETINP
jgi:hypothetical protein